MIILDFKFEIIIGGNTMLIKWKESFALGIDKVDQQHKEIFDKTNELIKLRKEKADRAKQYEQVGKVLDFLIDYVKSHFESEEKIQQKYNYPNYEKHKKIHQKFIARIEELQAEYEADDHSMSTLLQLSKTLLDWLVNHIGQADRKLANYLDSIDAN